MRYRGAYDSGTSYDVGDVVVFTDNIPYFAHKQPPVGSSCHDTLYWNHTSEEITDMVILFHSFLTTLQAADDAFVATKDIVDDMLFDDKTIILKSSTESSTTRYAVTVDDEDGLAATAIVDEGEGGDT